MIQVLHSEFQQCLWWATLCFVSGVSLREFAQDRTGKWLGRVSVFVSLCLLAAFGNFSIKQCQVIYAVASPNVSPVAVVAVEKEHSITTKAGIQIRWQQFTGGAGPVSITNGRSGFDGNTARRVDFAAAATGASAGSLPSRTSGRAF